MNSAIRQAPWGILCLAILSPAVWAEAPATPILKWEELPELPAPEGSPRQLGLAGAFSGVHHDALIGPEGKLSRWTSLAGRKESLVGRHLCIGTHWRWLL
jgi:hypothetical protein